MQLTPLCPKKQLDGRWKGKASFTKRENFRVWKLWKKKEAEKNSLQFVTVINFIASLRKPKSLQTANTAIISHNSTISLLSRFGSNKFFAFSFANSAPRCRVNPALLQKLLESSCCLAIQRELSRAWASCQAPESRSTSASFKQCHSGCQADQRVETACFQKKYNCWKAIILWVLCILWGWASYFLQKKKTRTLRFTLSVWYCYELVVYRKENLLQHFLPFDRWRKPRKKLWIEEAASK